MSMRMDPRFQRNGARVGPQTAVPILGQTSPAVHKYTCRAGHTYQGANPWRFFLTMDPKTGQGLQSGPACPICLLEFVAMSFPSWPADMTMTEAKAAGLLHPSVPDLDPAEEEAVQMVEEEQEQYAD